jgi:O-methyltransferase
MDFKDLIRIVVPENVVNSIRHVRGVLSVHPPQRYYERSGRWEFMHKAFSALAFNEISGDYLEFGSCGGMTFALAFKASRRANFPCKLWSFDSFTGLPAQVGAEDEHPEWVDRAMSMSLDAFRAKCKWNGIPDNDYVTIPGYYEDTIGRDDRIDLHLPKDVALAYIDCDLYSSTKVVLRFLKDRMKHGMIVALDDYYCYSARTISGERRACLEFLREDDRFHFSPFAQFGWHGMSFIVEDRALLLSPRPGIL